MNLKVSLLLSKKHALDNPSFIEQNSMYKLRLIAISKLNSLFLIKTNSEN